MKRLAKLILGLATILPICYMGYFFYFAFSQISSATPPTQAEQQFEYIFRLHISAMVLIVALMVFYIVHLFRSSAVAQEKKALWAVILFMGGFFAMPIYWFLYIWRENMKALTELSQPNT